MTDKVRCIILWWTTCCKARKIRTFWQPVSWVALVTANAVHFNNVLVDNNVLRKCSLQVAQSHRMCGCEWYTRMSNVQHVCLLCGTLDTILSKLNIPAVRKMLDSQICICWAQVENVSDLNETVDPSAVHSSVWWPKSYLHCRGVKSPSSILPRTALQFFNKRTLSASVDHHVVDVPQHVVAPFLHLGAEPVSCEKISIKILAKNALLGPPLTAKWKSPVFGSKI